jgi:hypothetical protein
MLNVLSDGTNPRSSVSHSGNTNGMAIGTPEQPDNTVVVVGPIQCADQNHCYFVPTPGFERSLSIDLVALPKESRRYLAMNCHDVRCGVLVIGLGVGDSLVAEAIQVFVRADRMHRACQTDDECDRKAVFNRSMLSFDDI